VTDRGADRFSGHVAESTYNKAALAIARNDGPSPTDPRSVARAAPPGATTESGRLSALRPRRSCGRGSRTQSMRRWWHRARTARRN